MSINFSKLILFFFCSAFFVFNALGQNQNPTDMVKNFYKFHNSRNGILSLHELKLHKRFFTPELYRLLLNELQREEEFVRKNHNDKPFFGDGLPFKPFEECVVNNVFYQNTYQINEVSTKPLQTIVEVKFFMPEACQNKLVDTYQIELVKHRQQWLINDWIYPDKSKLSDDLKRQKYQV